MNNNIQTLLDTIAKYPEGTICVHDWMPTVVAGHKVKSNNWALKGGE